jgi:hypothetical protein
VTVFDPRFNDPAHGDYGLRAGSEAVDFSFVDSDPAAAVDALGQPRNFDLPVKYQYYGVSNGIRDVGAFERQSLQPLVLNDNFDVDLRLWDVVTAGSTTRDTTQNASGAANSGSAHVHGTNKHYPDQQRGISHCVHLPGPALYLLNAWGRGTSGNLPGRHAIRPDWNGNTAATAARVAPKARPMLLAGWCCPAPHRGAGPPSPPASRSTRRTGAARRRS